MDNSIVPDEYQLLVEECKANFFTRITNSREELILAYGELGALIVNSSFFKRSGKGNQEFIEKLCDDANIAKREGYYAVRFYEEFIQKKLSHNNVCATVQTLIKEDFEANISWYKIRTKYLPTPKTIEKRVEDQLRESSMVEKEETTPVQPIDVVPEVPGCEIENYHNLAYMQVVKIIKRLVRLDPTLTYLNLKVERSDDRWDVRVVSDKKVSIPSVKAPQCPLEVNNPAFSPLREKYAGGHKECIQYITDVQSQDKGHKFVNFPKQIANVHRILRAGFDFEDMDSIIDLIKKDRFYQQNGWDMATVSQKLERR